MNKPSQRQTQNVNTDYTRYLKLIAGSWYWILISLLIAFAITRLFNVLSTRLYQVGCDIVIGENSYDPGSTPQLPGSIDFNQANPVNKEIGIIRSKNLTEQTLSKLDFDITYYELLKGPLTIKRRRYNEIPFQVVIDSNSYLREGNVVYLKILSSEFAQVYTDDENGTINTIKFNELAKLPNASFRLILRPRVVNNIDEFINKDYVFYVNSPNTLVNEYWQNLEVTVNPTSKNILTLSITGENVFQSMAYLNKLCKIYIENDLELRNRMASNTIDFIDGQLAILNIQLQAAEDSLIWFKRSNKLFQTEITSELSNQYLVLAENRKKEEFNRAAFLDIQMRLDSILVGKSVIIPLYQTITDEKLSAEILLINQLVIERDVLLKNQKSKSPSVILLSQKIEVETQAFKSLLQQEQFLILERQNQIQQQISSIEKELINIPSTERQLAKFTRDFELTENLYNLYQQKRIEAKLAKASTVSNIRMLDPPDLESAVLVSPKKNQNTQTGLLLGLAFPLALIVLHELISNKVRSTNDVSSDLDIPVLGKLAHSKSEHYLPTKVFPWAAITESFRTLHAKLKYILPEAGQNVIAITSATSGEGKTFCAMNLATVIAGAGKKVLLVGLDLRRPKIHEVFDLDNSEGLTTYIIGRSTIDSMIRDTDIPNLFIINSGPIPPNPVELIESKKLSDLISKFRKEYDFVIIDSPPIGLVADALLINNMVDLYLFVIRIDYSKKNIVSLLKEMQEAGTMKHLSLVFNDLKLTERYGSGSYNTYYQKEDPISWRNIIPKLSGKK